MKKVKTANAFRDGGFATALESRDHVTLAADYGHFINGKWVRGGEMTETINPSDETVLAEFSLAGKKEINAAVKAARAAYEGPWGKMPAAERGKYLFRIARLLQERAREFAVLESLDGGKPIRESRDVDVPLAAAHFFYHAGWADKLAYAFPGKTPQDLSPLGVIGQVIPWNFPLLMAAWKIAPALACGNTVVLKPAETTPLTALHLATLLQDAGLPPGVVNIVTGAGETGRLLTQHPDIDKVAFTGSTEVGKKIRRNLAGTDKRYTLELGGKAANIVFEDAALNEAVEGIINGIFFNQGHVCCAGSRLLVQESIADRLISRLQKRISTLVVGNPLDKNTDIGAINSKCQRDRIQSLIACGIDEGVTVWQQEGKLPSKGYWVPPTLLTDCAQSQRVVQEEIFGPVLTIQTFRTPKEAIEKANNTPYGLSGGVWSDKGAKVFKAASSLRAGVVWANTFNKFDPTSPFGGMQESGIGREGGLQGLAAYLDF